MVFFFFFQGLTQNCKLKFIQASCSWIFMKCSCTYTCIHMCREYNGTLCSHWDKGKLNGWGLNGEIKRVEEKRELVKWQWLNQFAMFNYCLCVLSSFWCIQNNSDGKIDSEFIFISLVNLYCTCVYKNI